MGKCDCGAETAWNDLCEDCLHEWEEQFDSDEINTHIENLSDEDSEFEHGEY